MGFRKTIIAVAFCAAGLFCCAMCLSYVSFMPGFPTSMIAEAACAAGLNAQGCDRTSGSAAVGLCKDVLFKSFPGVHAPDACAYYDLWMYMYICI